MRRLLLAALLALLASCSTPPPSLSSSPGPDDPGAPASNMRYRPVMAGTAYHGIGSKP